MADIDYLDAHAYAHGEDPIEKLRVSEADWQSWVIDVARLHGWRVAHHRPARTVHGWRTPIEGDPGVPDLILARAGEVLLAELKTDRGRPTAEQRAWLGALGDHGALWRPRDRDTVLARLSRRDTPGTSL